MKKSHETWSISKIVSSSEIIEFPEFQREPNIWNLEKKQRLIDSIVRGFDISAIYFYKREDKKYDCIDGQQRINAIWSYFGINDDSDPEDNKFHLKISNEVYSDSRELLTNNNKRFESLVTPIQKEINNYLINVVILEKVIHDDELNLQFLRLQLGAPLNAGEKLNAMAGELRDYIFLDLKNQDFFEMLKLSKKRFYKELVASQIVINEFTRILKGEFNRARFIDLQEFYREKESLNKADKEILANLKSTLKLISKNLDTKAKDVLRNRALVVSSYLFIAELKDLKKEAQIPKFFEFLEKLKKTIKWQVPKGIDMDKSYRNLLSFQTNITQAAAEKSAIQKRHDFLKEYYAYYYKTNEIIGDSEFRASHKKNPDTFRDKIAL